MTDELNLALAHFLGMETVAGNEQANLCAVNWLCEALISIGFEVELKGSEQSHQPLIVARYLPTQQPACVLYNHYDVEPVVVIANWDSAPFIANVRNGRMFARGVADNKAVLWARLFAMQKRLSTAKPLPPMLWLIQGEEEIGSGLAHVHFPAILRDAGASVFVEETGYYRDGTPLLFHKFGSDVDSGVAQEFIREINSELYGGAARIEVRSLSKFGTCPFISNLPSNAQYLGFGPNDYSAQIHRDNESISVRLLDEYEGFFDQFLSLLCKNVATGSE